MSASAPLAIAFGRRSVAVILGALVLAFGLAVFLVGDIAARQDDKARQQAEQFVKILLRERQGWLNRMVVDYADWGTAYKHLHLTVDFQWAYEHNNVGRTLTEDLGIEHGSVIADGGREVYAVVDGELRDPPSFLRLAGGAKQIYEAALKLDHDGHRVATGVVVEDGVPVLVAASVLAPGDDETVVPDNRPPSVLVFGDRLTAAEMAQIRDDLFVEELRFEPMAPDAEGTPFLTSTDGAHRFALHVSAPTPGRNMLQALLPWFVVVALALALFVAFLAQRGMKLAAMSREAAFALAEAHRLAEHQAMHDPVTGLPNRLMLARTMRENLSGSRDGLAVLYLDLDHFKPINDSHGHEAGDFVLRVVARRIEAELGPRELCARIGGDEFVVLADRGDDVALQRLCRTLIRTVSDEIPFADTALRVGVSIGVARIDATDMVDDAMRRADAALYEAKAAGRSRFHWAKEAAVRAAQA